jgi:nitrogen regulatory protein PII
MTKVEVIVGAEDAPVVRDLFTSAGVTGYTTVSGVSGMGHAGHHQGRLLFNDRAGLAMLITVLPDDHVDAILAGLRELFTAHSGVMFVTDTYVSRPDYFTTDPPP